MSFFISKEGSINQNGKCSVVNNIVCFHRFSLPCLLAWLTSGELISVSMKLCSIIYCCTFDHLNGRALGIAWSHELQAKFRILAEELTISPFFLFQAPPLLRLLPRGQLLRLLLRLLLLALPLPILLHQLRQHRQGKVAFNMIPLLDHHLRDMSIIWRTKDTQWKSLVESTIKHLMESLWSWRAAHSTRYMSRTPMPIVRMRTYIKPYISIL